MLLEKLVHIIEDIHAQLHSHAMRQVNNSLTIRNWLIGFYLFEYEQNGSDRAKYGAKLLKSLANKLNNSGLKGISDTNLKLFRQFYLAYPQISQTLSDQLQNVEFQEITKKSKNEIIRLLPEKLIKYTHKSQTTSDQSKKSASLQPELLLKHLSFSHFVELLKQDNSLKRSFYEIQTIKNNWSVRELKRAMETLLFERTGLSIDKEKIIAKSKDTVHVLPSEVVKNPYILEFLGLEEKPEYSESELEQAIITHLQKFLIEMGRGFCFEARQKRITFDNVHYHIDLVFYQRILKCHVLVDLKVGAFSHADAGQMNVYLNYFKENEMTEGDNPRLNTLPVGFHRKYL